MKDVQLVSIIAGCVLVKDSKYLLIQEKKQSAYGQWNLPAGRVDAGESIENAAIREVREETGLEVSLGKKISVEHASSDSPVLHAYEADVIGGELQFNPDELLDAKWFGLEEIRSLNWEGKIRNGWALRTIEQTI